MDAVQVAIGSLPVMATVVTCALRMERRFAKLEGEIERNRNETRRNRRLTGALIAQLFPSREAREILSAALSDGPEETEA